MEKENVQIDGVSIEVSPNIKVKKPRAKKEKIIPVSPKMMDTPSEFFGSKPILVKWKHWMLMCDIIKKSETFNKIYARETFKYGDLEDTAAVIKAVYTKDPQEIKNLDGKVIETIPGIYNEEETWVLPPKFTFPTYRRYFLSHPDLSWYVNESTPTLTKFQGYDFNMKFGPRPEQADLAEMAGNALRTQKYFKGIVQAAPGWGKFQYLSDVLATPKGWVKMGDIQEGDEVFSQDGTVTKVLGIYPQGIQDVYQFTFGDGTKTRAGLDHLWKVWNTDGRKWEVLTTKEILSKNYARVEKDKRYGDKSNGMRYKYFIPLCEPVQYYFDASDRTQTKGLLPLQHCFHPYALGLMLGDGSFRPSGNSFGFSDKFDKNIAKLKETLQESGYIDDINTWSKDSNNTHHFSSKKLKDICKIFGLDGKYSIEKHIPKEYLYASVESRKLLLEGLIATDGYVRTKSSWSYSTSSQQLKDDVCELARSLGYYVTIKINENNAYIYKGEKKRTEHVNYEICINYEKKRKAITKIEKLDYQEEAQCIMVEHNDSLYLTNDYIVTHNTYISINIGSQTNGQMMVIVPNNLLAGQWHKSLLEFTDLTEEDIGMIKGSDLAKLKRQGQNKKPVMICLIQSLDSQLQRGDFEELVDFYKDTAAVFYDETHTSGAADGYAKTSGVFSTYNIIGLSATPYKKDKNLFQLYTGIGQIVYISTHQNLIPSCNMHLLDVPISQKEERNLFDIFQKTNYNFFMSQLEDFLFKVDAYFTYLAEWLIYRHKQGYSSVVLFKTNKMLDKLQLFLDKLRGDLEIKSTILTNVTAKNNRKELASSNVILSNYKMFSAGADYPFLSCIFFASMILGKTPIIQSLGRVTRKHDTKIQEVQAHFLIPKFIYPMYTNNEPHLNIVRSVKLQYPEAQFKWDNGFTKYFEEKKMASKNLNANDLSNFQANQTINGQLPPPNPKGDFIVNGNYGSTNRLDIYRQQQIQSNNSGAPIRPQSYLPQ